MKKTTTGAWLISHTKKLQQFNDIHSFEDIELSGKCAMFLSNIATSEESALNEDKIFAIAKATNIKKTEIAFIKEQLADAQLIDIGKNGSISILAVTTSSVLSHATDIFENCKPDNFQKAAIELSNHVSDSPKEEQILKEYVSDMHHLTSSQTEQLMSVSEEVGLVDYEKLRNDDKLYFNGNLFRRDTADKTYAVLNSLSTAETSKITELDEALQISGCVSLGFAQSILGEPLLAKLQAIAMYDFNEVSNPTDSQTFLTKPAAFAKFGDPFEEDALDLAKAFVASLYYGMNFREGSKGKITMLKLLMKKLVRGEEVGPATAIGQDYKLLELKRVVQIRYEGSYLYFMKLLKRDVGELALQVLEKGETTEQTIATQIQHNSIVSYVGPEQLRVLDRKRQGKTSSKDLTDMLRTIRL
jgi:hypothetical protein